MRHYRVAWNHEEPDEPILLWSEVDEDSWEVRKVEIYADDSVGVADRMGATGDTRLSIVPLPAIDEINRQAEFRVVEVGQDEFLAAWASALSRVASQTVR